MSNFLRSLLGQGNRASASTAKERLRLVLIHDRADISPAVIDALKDEIIAVISRHVDINRDEVEISLSLDNRESRLVANIPLLPANSRRKRR
ncbi:MAG: cell division topological specificity factor MinE [Chloroflexi bacterium]|nr:cell division topological specificity factor MinE [Chloroflexota bacterium]